MSLPLDDTKRSHPDLDDLDDFESLALDDLRDVDLGDLDPQDSASQDAPKHDELPGGDPEDGGRDGDSPESDDLEGEDPAGDDSESDGLADDDPAGEDSEDHGAQGGWRAIFERELHPLELDQRIARARAARGDELFAFCHDPSFKVIAAVLDNPTTGLEHARLIARHHRGSQGLDTLAARHDFRRDHQVRRLLLRNPQASDRLIRRLVEGRRMAQVYQQCLSREITERARHTLRRAFRESFRTGSAEERTSLILKSEGRCLALLVGLALDAKAASLLCRRPLGSTLLIQNLARWPATPPPVLAHMTRQPVARRNPTLRNLILRHPNAPAQLKRSL